MLGTKHPETLSTLKATAETTEFGKLDEVERRKSRFGTDCGETRRRIPETLRLMNDLADLTLPWEKKTKPFISVKRLFEIERKAG